MNGRFVVRISRLITQLGILTFGCGLLLSPHALSGEGRDIAVVVRPDTPVDGLTLAQIRKLWLGEQQFWNSKLRVTLLLRAPAAVEREVVLKVIYHMNEAEFRQYWISKLFRAEAASGPKIVYSNSMATELINALPGSVAFMDAAQVPKGLKMLKIDDKLPGQAGYPLR